MSGWVAGHQYFLNRVSNDYFPLWNKDRNEAEDIKPNRPNRQQKILRRGGKNTQKNCTKKIFTTKIITMVWSLT